MNERLPFPFQATEPPPDSDEDFFANGIFADTGLPLCQITAKELAEIAATQASSTVEQRQSRAKFEGETGQFLGTIGDVDDPNNLSQAGWGIVFPAQADDARRQALAPLIEHRRKQVVAQSDGISGDVLFQVFDKDRGVKPNESCTAWLARMGVGMHAVDPLEGVPFFLLLVGSPQEIPFDFQYLLDIHWGVGRLHFDDPADYRRYAESVVAYETASTVTQSKTTAIFAARHSADRATQMFADQVAQPLALGQPALNGTPPRPPIGQKQGFATQSFIGKDATKGTLTKILQGKTDAGPPALLLTGSHGMGFRPDDPRLVHQQGALLCQDWSGFGSVRPEHWYPSSDLPTDARLHGLIHFCFACYGAGCPQFDDFVVKPGQAPSQIAPRPLVASLPQKMLAHPNGGALASLGHVDRAWASSFSTSRAGPQLQGFRDVMGRILRGDRLGQATDQFDVRRAALSFELTELRRDLEYGKQIPDRQMADLWIARNDARNYVILGDPAVRLRVEDL